MMNARDMTLTFVFGHHAKYAPYQKFERRDVTLHEYVSLITWLEKNPLICAAKNLLDEAFGYDERRDSGTLHRTHALAVARGSVLMAMRDGASREECIQQYVVGLLHDVKEDRPTFSTDVDNLKHHGLDNESITSIDLLTKPEGVRRFDNISRILPDRVAIRAKYADSYNNSSAPEQMREGARGRLRHSYRSYAISCSAMLAVVEGRIPDFAGMIGYLLDVGRDLITKRNMPLFEKNFRSIGNILDSVVTRY